MATLTLDFTRHLTVNASTVRAEVARALEAIGFELGTNQLTLIEAKRGSKLGAAVLAPKKMPVRVRVDLEPGDSGCRVTVHVEDALDSPIGKTYGVNSVYERVFHDLQEQLDAGLARVDPAAAAAGFESGDFASTTRDLGLLERANVAVGEGEKKVAAKVGEVLDGGARDTAPAAWKGVDQVWFEGPDGVAALSLAEAQAHLAIAALVAGQPGALPDNLARELERFAARVERLLTDSPPGVVHVELPDAERPVFEFMHLQARLRDALPLRTLHRCRDCKFEKITNPDYQRLAERNRKLRALTGAVGATVSGGGIRPFVLVGTLFQLKRLDPDYVCSRCQGMEADESLATFCPSCGDLRREAVLRACPKCGHDLRTVLAPESPPLWGPPPVAPEPESAQLPQSASLVPVGPPADTVDLSTLPPPEKQPAAVDLSSLPPPEPGARSAQA